MLNAESATSTLDAPLAVDIETLTRGSHVETLKAEDIEIEYDRVENEIIPLGNKKIEVVMASVPLDQIKLDKNNPRIQFRLALHSVTNPDQEKLREIMWGLDEVKALKRSIYSNGGVIDAIIISGKDGTVFEGNSRLTCQWKLWEDEGFDPASEWAKIKARILPPTVNRGTIDTLLGELHISGKNKWSAFEQASHLHRMHNNGGASLDALAQTYRLSKGYVSAKLRAYSLMNRTFIPMAKKANVEINDLSTQWSWFEEFFKKCKPGIPPKLNQKRVYDGPELEDKFCEWVVNGQLPQAADVRKLYDCLEDEKAIGILDKGGGIEKAHNVVASRRPELQSKLWKEVENMAEAFEGIELPEIEALRDGDQGRLKLFERLAEAIGKIRKEVNR